MDNVKQTYTHYVMLAQSRLLEITTNLNMRTDENILYLASQLQEYLNYPLSNETVILLANTLQSLEQYMLPYQKRNIEIPEGISSSYTKVKKSGNFYIPTEEVHDIDVPNYDIPNLNSNVSMRDSSDPFMKMAESSSYPSNRGSSNIWMLAFLSFLFESLFLILSFFLYRS